MYQISQFSKISGLTVKALRYYDEQGMLKPSYRDKNTLYRYYDENDLKKAQLIRLLRSLDFSISEIKEVLEMVNDEADLTYILQEKIANIKENILREKELIKKINGYLLTDVTKTESQAYQITLEEIPATLVASIRFIGKYSQIGEHIPFLYKAVQGNVNGAVISSSPMVNGRLKVFEFEKKLADRLNVSIQCKSGSDYKKISQLSKDMIDQNKPILIYVDMPYLSYLGLNKNHHFGGHAVVLFGYDNELEQFWISDRDNHDYPIRTPFGEIAEDYHLVSYREMEQARSSVHRPFPAKNKYLLFDFQGYRQIDREILTEAIAETCDTMLKPPAKLLGVNGILKFSTEILKWEKFSPDKMKLSGTTNYFQISKDGGTGGGIFRKMYGDFLIEAAVIMDNKYIAMLGKQFLEVATQWDKIAEDLWQLSLSGNVSLLQKMSKEIMGIYHQEKNLYQYLQGAIA